MDIYPAVEGGRLWCLHGAMDLNNVISAIEMAKQNSVESISMFSLNENYKSK